MQGLLFVPKNTKAIKFGKLNFFRHVRKFYQTTSQILYLYFLERTVVVIYILELAKSVACLSEL